MFVVVLKLLQNYFYSYLDRTGRAGLAGRVGGRVRRVAGQGPGVRQFAGYSYCTVILQSVLANYFTVGFNLHVVYNSFILFVT